MPVVPCVFIPNGEFILVELLAVFPPNVLLFPAEAPNPVAGCLWPNSPPAVDEPLAVVLLLPNSPPLVLFMPVAVLV